MSCRMWNELIVGIIMIILAFTLAKFAIWQTWILIIAGIYLIVHGLWCRKCDLHMHEMAAVTTAKAKKRRR